MKVNGSYELHLTVREACLQGGMEWEARFSNWLMIQVSAGTGYWIHTKQNLQLEPGAVLVIPPGSDGSLRASQMGNLSFCFFCVDPMRLMGLFTLTEQAFFRDAASTEDCLARAMPAQHPLAVKLREILRSRKQTGSLFRLQLLQSFIEMFEAELAPQIVDPEPNADAKQRLSEFLNTAQTAELINLSFSDLVDVSRCTPRHLSRIFREVVGMSFRDKQAELRLTLACDLLATTELKIVDVALESGFQSLSLFNLMFARRFGISPGRWRQKSRENKLSVARGSRKNGLMASAF